MLINTRFWARHQSREREGWTPTGPECSGLSARATTHVGTEAGDGYSAGTDEVFAATIRESEVSVLYGNDRFGIVVVGERDRG
jgi:hypothetical protein